MLTGEALEIPFPLATRDLSKENFGLTFCLMKMLNSWQIFIAVVSHIYMQTSHLDVIISVA